jgi:alpha-1,3-rhamnosyl/mannosyltransferase
MNIEIHPALHVALDVNPLYTARAGVARYVAGLMYGFRQIGFAYTPVAWEVTNFEYGQPGRAFKTLYREFVWPRTRLPGALRAASADMLHYTHGMSAPPPRHIATVTTLHDVAVRRHPDRYRRWHRHSSGSKLRRLRQADRVICVSAFTASEAMQLLDLPAEKLTVIHEGCRWVDDPPEEQPHPNTPREPYFLFVGSLEPGKNLRLLRQAYILAESRAVSLPPLLVVGVRWEGLTPEGPAPANWHYCGYIPDDQLVFLLRRARALLYPTRYEGFGLPLLEAMAAGCPVLCGPVASLPEVGGDAALYAALEPESFLDAMVRMSRDDGLREELVRRGRMRVAGFSWARCARKTADVYREVLETTRPRQVTTPPTPSAKIT